MPTLHIINQSEVTHINMLPQDMPVAVRNGVNFQAKRILDGAFGTLDAAGNFQFDPRLTNSSSIFQGGAMQFAQRDLLSITASEQELEVIKTALANNLKSRWSQAYDEILGINNPNMRALAQIGATPSVMHQLLNHEKEQALGQIAQFNEGKNAYIVPLTVYSESIDAQEYNGYEREYRDAIQDAHAYEQEPPSPREIAAQLLKTHRIEHIEIDANTPVFEAPAQNTQYVANFTAGDIPAPTDTPMQIQAKAQLTVMAESPEQAKEFANILLTNSMPTPRLMALTMAQAMKPVHLEITHYAQQQREVENTQPQQTLAHNPQTQNEQENAQTTQETEVYEGFDEEPQEPESNLHEVQRQVRQMFR